MDNKKLPKYENPIPPPPLTDEGKAWAKFFFKHLEIEKNKKDKETRLLSDLLCRLAILMFLLFLIFYGIKP